jgi:hypothetical protein
MTVRAMLYVTSINQVGYTQNGEARVGNVAVHLSCVYGTTPGTEKHRFWTASPSGKAEMRLKATDEFWKPGASYYFDFERDEEGEFFISRLTQNMNKDDDGPCRIEAQWWSPIGTIEISIDNKEVFDFHELGKSYRVIITPVPEA